MKYDKLHDKLEQDTLQDKLQEIVGKLKNAYPLEFEDILTFIKNAKDGTTLYNTKKKIQLAENILNGSIHFLSNDEFNKKYDFESMNDEEKIKSINYILDEESCLTFLLNENILKKYKDIFRIVFKES